MMKKITVADVEKIASLARLTLTDTEKKDAVKDLSNILDYVQRLSEVKTGSTDPYSPEAVSLKELRSDTIVSFSNRDALLSADTFHDDLLATKAIFSDDHKE